MHRRSRAGYARVVKLVIGTSGWQYRDWRGAFYPENLAQRQWLQHYAARFSTVELNNSFYRLPPRERFAMWAAATPLDFVVAPKVSRYLTHIKRLRDPTEPVARFSQAVSGLERKLGPALVQLPPTLQADPQLLDAALALFPTTMRVAVEFRHATWETDQTREVLARHGAACCWAERKGRWIAPRWRTADWGYVRFHEGDAQWPCYRRTTLATRLDDIAAVHGTDEVFVYFNNDPRCCAVADAIAFAELAAERGVAITRMPDPGDVRVVDPADR